MTALDLRILVAAPFALAEFFLVWVLWNLARQSRRKKSRAPLRLVSITQTTAPPARVFDFPKPSYATPLEKQPLHQANSPARYFAPDAGVSASSAASSTRTAEPGTRSKLTESLPVG